MSKMKKIASVLLAVVMVLALNVTVLAADTYTITINYSEDNHIYEAYQIFSGTLSEYSEYTGDGSEGKTVYTYDGTTYTVTTYDAAEAANGTIYYYYEKVLSDILWGSGVDGDALLAALTDDTYTYYNVFKDCTTAADVADVLSAQNTNEALAESFAQLASENLSTTVAGTSTETVSPYKITGLNAGYYLVKDKDNSVTAGGDSYTDIILQVVADVTVTAKASTTTFDKEVDSTTDLGETDYNETTADYDIGDSVPFTLIAALPTNYASYSTYELTFHDTLSTGLDFNNDVTVTVYTAHTGLTAWGTDTYYTYDSTTKEFSEVTASDPSAGETYYTKTEAIGGYSVTQPTTDGCSFDVYIADTNKLTGSSGIITVSSSSIIVVDYTAKLLSSAANMETNEAYLEYSNNPNKTGNGFTPKDITTVITFTLDVKKVDESNQPLSGAGFKLYKAVEADTSSGFTSGTTYYTIDDSTGLITAVDTDTTFTPVTGTTYYVYEQVGSEVTGVTTFEFAGLGIGYYKLEESTTPTGYNTMDDLYFTIEAATYESSETGYVKTLIVKDSDGSTISRYDTEPDNGESFTASLTSQTISTVIKNLKGSSLPTTGGIGTTVFYVVGGVMVAGALVLLITRLRMSKKKSV